MYSTPKSHSVLRVRQTISAALCAMRIFKLTVEMLLYVHRNRRFMRDGSPGRPPRLSHNSSWALNFFFKTPRLQKTAHFSCPSLFPIHLPLGFATRLPAQEELQPPPTPPHHHPSYVPPPPPPAPLVPRRSSIYPSSLGNQ